MNKIFSFVSILILVISGYSMTGQSIKTSNDDLDPLVDIILTFEITAIRALDEIEENSNPDFFVKITINDETFTSPTWHNLSYFYDGWSISKDVSDEVEFVNIDLELWDNNTDENTKCDISKNKNTEDQGFFANIYYNIKTGHWYGDDYCIGDQSGYGRLCGSSDGSIYEDENDCEIWFNIYQNDYDNDSLPYWIETYVYDTDPEVSNTGEDLDSDGVPIEWEHKWGFNPLIWEDHYNYDPDGDSITNFEEFLTRNFSSDPFRKDVFLELDFMEESPDGISSVLPANSIELLKKPFHRRNIVFHIDTGQAFGGDEIPFDESVNINEIEEICNNFYLNDNDWKRGVFHYGLLVYKCRPTGFAFGIAENFIMGYAPGTNAFIISSSKMDENANSPFTDKTIDYFFGSAIMHEMGHNFGFRWGDPFGCDAQRSKMPWMLGYWIYGRYKSIMNYRYTFKIFDYSDGSHGLIDNDDWEQLDLSYFEIP